uniref:SOS1 protein n=1 Tax=Fagopyrum tataricum TaxID=62330 RepID=A0A2L2FKX5_FAGTA|nr:SOS1 protein [Fagopyrum tataricum]
MVVVDDLPFPYRVTLEENQNGSSSEESSSSDPTDALIFVGVSLVLGIASRHLLRRTRVPYTVALLIIGIALGSLEYGTKHGLGRFGHGIRLWEHINPDLLLAVFLPALLFESSFSMEVHQIKKCIWHMLLLAGPGVLISTFCIGSALKLSFPYDWSWKTSLLLGGLLSATDPVAVVALLKELGASKKLNTIIEGESLMNDGTAIVIYQLFYQMVLGKSYNWASILKYLAEVSLGAVGIGLAFGMASVLWIGFIFNDTVIEITLTLAVSYIAYFTAQEGADVSGVLTVMTLGMFYAAAARTAFKGDGQQSLHHFWEMVAYIANTLIFILSGTIIAESALSSDGLSINNGYSWGYLILLYVYVQISRVIVVGVLYPFLRQLGYGLDWKEAIILIWSGLRGAVALSLSLSIKRSSGNTSRISSETGSLFVFFTGGIVFLTLVLNGSTTQFVLHLLRMDRLSSAKRRILEFTKYEMLNKALEAYGDLGEDEELGPADWPTVKSYIKSLDNVEGERMQLHDVTESGSTLDPSSLKDIRVRLLNGVQAAYWVMLDEGRITQTTANILMQSVDEALDFVAHEPLCDWKGLKSQVNFPSYYKFLQMSICPRKLVTFFTVERLESACYICAAFLRAHKIARRQLREFIGESEIAFNVSNESEAEGEEAKKFLEDVRMSFPQVLRLVKTRQVTHAVLKHLIDYVQNLEKAGLLEQKEMAHLHDAVEADMKRLVRNPPLVKVPKIGDMISVHPLLGALPSTSRDLLIDSTKEVMKTCGMTLYKEGSKPNGIWLICNGVVKWTSRIVESNHALHPTFTHGITLGLYEVLSGKPYIMDMTPDSLVFCFFIETDKIHSVLRSDPFVEDFFWKESVIVLSKVLLPRVFEKMTMQDLRLRIAERSTITSYENGGIIEVAPHSIGFLLEGCIKSRTFPEQLITSPAVLCPTNGDSLSLPSQAESASFCYNGSLFHADKTARVMMLDMGTLETEALQRRSSSSILKQRDHSGNSLSREHGGLMSWPEHYHEAVKRQLDSESMDERMNLSARAMQLSIFGTMVDKVPWRANRSHSFPYQRVSSSHGRPLISVRSEGSAMNKRAKEEYKQVDLGQTLHTAKPIVVMDDSSDEEDVIVRIDSPSGLSFHHAS